MSCLLTLRTGTQVCFNFVMLLGPTLTDPSYIPGRISHESYPKKTLGHPPRRPLPVPFPSPSPPVLPPEGHWESGRRSFRRVSLGV